MLNIYEILNSFDLEKNTFFMMAVNISATGSISLSNILYVWNLIAWSYIKQIHAWHQNWKFGSIEGSVAFEPIHINGMNCFTRLLSLPYSAIDTLKYEENGGSERDYLNNKISYSVI